MRKKLKNSTSKTDRLEVTSKKKGKSVFGDTAEIWCTIDVKISQSYQSVGISAGKKSTVPEKKSEAGFKKLWTELDEQIAAQLPDARRVLEKLGE